MSERATLWSGNPVAKLVSAALVGAMIAWGVQSIPALWRESAQSQVAHADLVRRVERLEVWGPQAGDRYSAQRARDDWQKHEFNHGRLERKLDRLLIRAGIDPASVE